ncbi:VOC family protein [Nesterenkonia suensis]
MTLCLPFLMFQGQAQEAIDLYLETFQDAELIEIQHHPEGTAIFDSGPPEDELTEEAEERTPDAGDDSEPEADGEDRAPGEDEVPVDAADNGPGEEPNDDAEAPGADSGAQADLTSDGAGPDDALITDAQRAPRTGTDLTTVEAEPEPADPPRLVATAQILVGGQVLMIQDSLATHDFSFTPSVSVAVVVDSTAEFDEVVEKLSQGGSFLMEPGDYEFAKNFAWIQDRFGMSWQVNHPLTAPDENIAQAQAPDWG